MTDAVILALIALGEKMIYCLTFIIFIQIVLKAVPRQLKLLTGYGQFEANFDTRVDE